MDLFFTDLFDLPDKIHNPLNLSIGYAISSLYNLLLCHMELDNTLYYR